MNDLSIDVSSAIFADSSGSKKRSVLSTTKCLCLVVIAIAFLGGLALGFCFSVPQCSQQVFSARPPASASPPSPSPVSAVQRDEPGVVTFVAPVKLTDDSPPPPLADRTPSRATGAPADAAVDDAVDSQAVHGIYWSAGVESALPYGYDESDAQRWRDYVKSNAVKQVTEGCGRMQNRLVTFANGTKSCVRYRQNNDQIQGEIFTFYLAQLMGVKNLPPSSVHLVDGQWSGVRAQLGQAQWSDERPVVMTQFLDDLQPAYIPSQFKTRQEASLSPADVARHRLDDAAQRAELVTLAQWSDLVVLDYLTANLDRMVNNMYNMQWNQAMMDSPAHNLARHPATGLLVFLDNESGLLHGYRLLDKYEPFHEQLIGSVCVFRRGTLERLRRLSSERSVGRRLRELYERTNERDVLDALPFLPEKSVKILNRRIDRVLDQAAKCAAMYSSNEQLVTS